MSPSNVKQQTFPRSSALTRACPGERIVASAETRSTDIELGHSTLQTLGDMDASPLTDEQAAGLGRLVRRIVNSAAGLPGGFDTVEDLCRSYLDAQLSRASVDRTRIAMQRTLDKLRPAASSS
ncbi:hypothetical protein FK531_06235 [Rhodococcus spelaei]|uniref:Uncharacterized protein n=1 Tax=Rhodococcus spelaei TaxID=2546320 RepID=A0A541BPI6_9NOCA|nr:hypothetical protein [Rhodococcus spelaei]TQF74233.1 hypothetical protein FK531_06235 [Rhodococcus spelaei]